MRVGSLRVDVPFTRPGTCAFLKFLRFYQHNSLLILIAAWIVLGGRAPGADDPAPAANFVDVAQQAGLTMTNVFGGRYTKKYIIETTGTGVAIFDYDNDCWPDIFIVNGTTLEPGPGPAPTNHLYRNNHDGTFRSEEHTSELQSHHE